MSSIKELKRGVFWSMVEVAIKRIVDLIIKLVLARLLLPEDFGLIGMATVFISFIEVINDAGVGRAIIQRPKELLTQEHLSTSFIFNLVFSAVLYLIIVLFISPLAASFYGEPKLLDIFPVLSISLLTSSLNTIHKSLLMKNMKFKEMSIISNTSRTFAGVIAVVLAYLNFGVWALVLNSVAAYLLSVPLSFYLSKWRPSFLWSTKALKDVFGFGIYVTLTALLLNLANNVDYLSLGKFVDAAAVGAYSLAFMFTNLVKAQVTSMIDRVMYPFYSAMQNDKSKIISYYLTLKELYCLIIYPVMVVLITWGYYIITFLFGSKWVDAIVPMRILAIGVIIQTVYDGFDTVLRSIGKPNIELKIQILTTVFIYIPIVLLGGYYYGLTGCATAVVISRLLSLFVVGGYLKKHLEVSFRDLLLATLPSLRLLVKSLVVVYVVSFMVKSTIILLVVFCACYGILLCSYLYKKGYLKKIYK